ncbi:MAG TPA: PDZ domain-containing protein [Gemmatimonadaceae bacterium]
MRFHALLPTVLATSALVSPLAAQDPRILRAAPGTIDMPGARTFGMMRSWGPRAVIGVSTTSGATARDTLGVLVSSVRSGSPAEKAGIEEGDRIASVNGVSLKLAAIDIGDDEMAGIMARRLTRELDKLKPGDDVDVRIYANGAVKAVKIKTESPSDLYESRTTRPSEDRATLGLNLAVTGSRRDTIGVFVLSVEDGGPAAKAGIEEGSRIASINGVDVRGRHADDDDAFLFPASNVSRLEREISRLKPGDDVDLRIYFNGQMRNVKLKAGRASDLPRSRRSVTIIGNDNFMIPGGMARINAPQLEADVRHAVESGMAGMGRVFAGIGGRVDW